jgi:hypothetical protein
MDNYTLRYHYHLLSVESYFEKDLDIDYTRILLYIELLAAEKGWDFVCTMGHVNEWAKMARIDKMFKDDKPRAMVVGHNKAVMAGNLVGMGF